MLKGLGLGAFVLAYYDDRVYASYSKVHIGAEQTLPDPWSTVDLPGLRGSKERLLRAREESHEEL